MERLFLVELVVSQQLPSAPRGADGDGPFATLFCRDAAGESVALVVTGWRPWFRVFARSATTDVTDALQPALANIGWGVARATPERVRKLYGWVPDARLDTQAVGAVRLTVKRLRHVEDFAERVRATTRLETGDTLQPPRVRFLHDTGLCPCAWFEARDVAWAGTTATRYTTAAREGVVDVGSLSYVDLETIPPLRILSFDCEMSSHDGLLPSPHKGDTTFCISSALGRFGSGIESDSISKVSIVLGKHGLTSDDTHTVVEVDTFGQLMETWAALVRDSDPDIVTGWNIDGFDFGFLAQQYEAQFLPLHARVGEALANALLDTPLRSLHDLAAAASPAVRRAAVKTMLDEFGVGLAPVLRKLEMTTSVAMDTDTQDADDDDGDAEASPILALSPSQHWRLRALLGGGDPPALTPRDVTAAFGPEAQALVDAPPRGGPRRGMMLGRFVNVESKLEVKTMSSAAKGDNVMEKIPMAGRVVLDMMRVVKDDQKPPSNALRWAADTWLGEEFAKLDVTPQELFAIWKTRDADGMRRVVDYCARDAEIPLRLLIKLQYMTSWLNLCRVCALNLDSIVNGGQQQRVFSLIARRVRDTHVINIEPSGWPDTPDYVGATVIEPEPNFYTRPLSTLDFASLYPSIEASNNLCFSTLVTDRTLLPRLRAADGRPLYQDFQIEHPRPDGSTETRSYAFVTHVKSVLSDLLIHLLTSRKSVKKQMEAESDPFLRDVYNKRQLALKVVCNSVYGFTGVNPDKGILSCKPVAAATTLIGRRLIGLTKSFVEREFAPARVVYGDTDSVMIHWGVESLEEAFALGETAARRVTEYLRGVMRAEQVSIAGKDERDISAMTSIVKLEHEKEYWPYLLLKKKNYAGRKWTPKALGPPIVWKDEIDVKGIQAVRRDTVPWVATLSNDILDALLLRRDAREALGLVKARLTAVADGTMPLDQFVISKSLASSYVNAGIPHVAAWQRMRARGDADPPPIGARMPFVIVAPRGSKSHGLAERAEHPAWVAAHGKKLDVKYYIKGAQNAVAKLLQFFDKGEIEELFAEAAARADNRGVVGLDEFCGGEAMLAPSPGAPRVKKRKTGTVVALTEFA